MIGIDYLNQIILTFGLFLYSLIYPYITPHNHLIFIEKDPSLSYPFVPDQVTHSTNLIISIAIPLIILIAIQFRHGKAFTQVNYWLGIGLAQCLLTTLIIYSTLKIIIGCPRPNFFAVCNYNHYNQTLSSGNFAFYDSLTQFGRFGDINHCFTSPQLIDYAFQSFPSGHAGLSFASMTYSVFLLKFLFDPLSDFEWEWSSTRGFISTTPLYLAGWVSLTRLQDYKHRPVDVVCGALIGVIIAFITWQNSLYYAKLIKDNPWVQVLEEEDDISQNEDDRPQTENDYLLNNIPPNYSLPIKNPSSHHITISAFNHP